MSDLDFLLMMTARKEAAVPLIEASTFVVGLKKIADAMNAAPDTTGQVEGPFLVPLPEAVELMAQMVSNEFKTQVYYTYYSNMLRGLSHESIAEEFMEHASDELEHANYLLRRIGVLSPGGISIPPYPPPPPMTDPQEIIQSMIVVEQMGVSLWKQLHSILGENPMKYTVEQFLQKEEEHQDELWQLVDPVDPMAAAPMPSAEPALEAPKTAEEILNAASLRKEASLALTRQELLRAGMDPSYAGKKQHGTPDTSVSGWKGAADLTQGARAQVSESNFVFPETRKYPIHDKDHALAALGLVGIHGSAEEKSTVRAAVEKKYPGLQMQKKADRDDVIKAKAKSLITSATENIRKMTDLIPKADQNRVEIITRSPESLLHEKAVFDIKKKDPLTKIAVSPLELVMGAVPGAAGGFAGAGDGAGSQALGTLAGGGAGYLATRGMHHLLGKIPNSAIPSEASLPLSVLAAMSVPAASLAAGYGAGRGVRALTARPSPDATIQPVGEPVSAMKQANVLHGSLVGAGIGAGLGAGTGALAAGEGHRLEGAGAGALGGGALGALVGGKAGKSIAKSQAWGQKVDAQNAHINDLLAQARAGRAAHEAQLVAARAERAAILPNAIAAAKEQLGKTSSLSFLISKLAEDIMLPPPGADSPESYVAREQQLAAQQAMAEASHAKTVSMQSAQAAQQAQAEAQAAQQQLQEAQQQLQQSQAETQQSGQQALQATQQASEAEARATEHSVAKMQLGMRVNQLRQELANLVMQDPVSEHAATVSDLAAQGQPATPQQQAEAEAAQQQAVDPATGQPAQPSADAQQEGQEAQNAQQQAEVQGAQAEQAQQADQAKGQKQAGRLSDFIGRKVKGLGDLVGHAGEPFVSGVGGRSADIGSSAAHAGHEFVRGATDETGRVLKDLGHGALDAIKAHPVGMATGVLGVGGMAAAPVLAVGHHIHKSNKREERMAKALEAMAANSKSAGLGDRNLAHAVMSGERDTLGRQLIDIVRKGIPAEAALASAGHAVRGAAEEGGKAVTENLPTLGEKLKPHLPGLVAGLGTGIIGTRMLSGGQQQQAQTQPLGYAQYYGQGQ